MRRFTCFAALAALVAAGCDDKDLKIHPNTPEITTVALDNAMVGLPYTASLKVWGGKGPYTWSLQNRPSELSWLEVSAEGMLSGTPQAVVLPAVPFTAQVTDANGHSATRQLSLSAIACTPGQVVACYRTTGAQCLQSSLVCSAQATLGTCDGGAPSTNLEHCGSKADGSCGACSSTSADSCTDGTCQCGTNPACGGTTPTCCGGTCADTNTDPNHCGAACTACPAAPADGHATCTAGQCGTACNEGYVQCKTGCCPKAVAISAGWHHVCAVMANGGVKCWGKNEYGQLGNNDIVNSASPVDVLDTDKTPLSGVVSVTASLGHSCALLKDGRVKCWGKNGNCQLGDGGNGDRHVAVDVRTEMRVPLRGAKAIAAGTRHTCALMNNGAVKCWGRVANSSGKPDYFVAVDMPGLESGVVAVAAGGWSDDMSTFNGCVVMSGGGLKCWKSDGVLVDMVDYAGVSAVGVGSCTVCAVAGGVAKCDGQVLNGVGEVVTASPGGLGHVAVLTRGGGVKCVGLNGGQVGDSCNSNSLTDVVGLTSGVRAIDSGSGFSCALLEEGSVRCWGINDLGQLGSSDSQGHGPFEVSLWNTQ